MLFFNSLSEDANAIISSDDLIVPVTWMSSEKLNLVLAWFQVIDSLAPAISIPAPSAAAESDEPLATVINLSSILRSETANSTESPNTFKFPLIVTLLKEALAKLTLEFVFTFWSLPPKYPHCVADMVVVPIVANWVASPLVNATPCTFATFTSFAVPVTSPPRETWDEPLITVSASNFVFTLVSV